MTKRLIRFDWAIKKLLRNKSNFVVLEGFLSELLFDAIKITQILESESKRNVAPQDDDEDKYNRVDILTQNSKNELVIIEIQNTYEIDYFHRMAYGTSKSLTEHLSLGQKYSEIKKIISINIVYFDLGQGIDYVYRGRTNFEGFHEKDILQLSMQQKQAFLKKEVADIFPEYYLIKVNQFDDIAKDTLDEWIYFLKNSEVKDNFKAKGLAEAKEILDMMRLSKEGQYGYNRYLDSLHLKASEIFSMQMEAEDRVRKDENYKRTVEIAKKLIQRNLSSEDIAEDTGLTIKEIEQIRSEKQA